jgi:hypothetical protein
MLSKTGRYAALATLVAAIGAMSITALPASASVLKQSMENWSVSGSLTPKKLGQPVTLPEHSTFNGRAELTYVLNFENLKGTLEGTVKVPPFTAMVPLLGLVPTKVGVTFEQVEKAVGTIKEAPSATCPEFTTGDHCVEVNVPTKVNVGITKLATGAELPGIGVEAGLETRCQTAEPIEFNLDGHLTLLQLAVLGPHFAGTTTIPNMVCTGPEALVLETALTALMSGPENPYAIKISRPLG